MAEIESEGMEGMSHRSLGYFMSCSHVQLVQGPMAPLPFGKVPDEISRGGCFILTTGGIGGDIL